MSSAVVTDQNPGSSGNSVVLSVQWTGQRPRISANSSWGTPSDHSSRSRTRTLSRLRLLLGDDISRSSGIAAGEAGDATGWPANPDSSGRPAIAGVGVRGSEVQGRVPIDGALLPVLTARHEEPPNADRGDRRPRAVGRARARLAVPGGRSAGPACP